MTHYNILKAKYRVICKPLGLRRRWDVHPYSSGTTSKNYIKKGSVLESLVQGYLSFLWKLVPSVQQGLRTNQAVQPPPKLVSSPPPTSIPPTTIAATQNPVDIGKALTEWLVSDKDILEEMKQTKPDVKPPSKNTSFFDWINWSKPSSKDPSIKVKQPTKKTSASSQIKLQGSIEGRSLFLLKSLVSASSPHSQSQRLEDLCRHLLVYPEEKNLLIKKGALPLMLKIQKQTHSSEELESTIRQALTLLGYTGPPGGRGLRILSVDGGGTRGIMAIEILRQLESRTGKRVYELFDYACGVSTGAIMVMVLFAARRTIDECEHIYLTFGKDIFSRNALVGTGNLLWSQAYYDTAYYVKRLQDFFGDLKMVDTAKYEPSPKISAVSTIVNQPLLKVFVFRNYALPFRANSVYPGSCQHKVWEAVRASGAAPGYFESFPLDGYVHQDGGLAMNNPTALAIHEAKLLWPGEKIQCVVSLGSGRFKFLNDSVVAPGLKTTLYKVLDSATDTEAFHTVLRDHLPSHTYFRFNPYMTEQVYLDESRQDKLEGLKMDAHKYLQWNEHKLSCAVQALTTSRSLPQQLMDSIQHRALLWKH